MKAQDLTELLDPASQSRVHDVVAPVPSGALGRIATRHGYGVFRMNCAKLTDKESFMDAAATAFGLPPYFGRNWDAFRDCLATMEWRPGNGYVVVVAGTEEFGHNAPDEARIVRDIFTETAADWGRRGRPFHVLWVGAPR